MPNPSSIAMADDWAEYEAGVESPIPPPRTRQKPCPRDTDGDGNCGQAYCPDCGPHRHELVAAKTRLEQAAIRVLAEAIRDQGNARQRSLAIQIIHECQSRIREANGV